ncbi:hypothetical protein V6N11_069650 [Hibiscus sabdariffa]|uniref:Uncharacterized protein n=1 Tax=Hibiscus sabdariffa TaxID=183260 RepID=A0ABR2Q3Z6_9ROSI
MTFGGPTNMVYDVPDDKLLEDFYLQDVYLQDNFSKELDSASRASIKLGLARKASRKLMHLDEQAKRVRKAKGQAHLARNSSELAQTASNLS